MGQKGERGKGGSTFGTTYILLDMTSTSGVCTRSFTSSSLSTITRVFLWVARCFSPTGFG